MSRGLGRIQRECLRVIESYGKTGKRPTTFNIVAEVYQIKRDRLGNRTCNDAQHTAVKRALAGLRREGLVAGQQDVVVLSNGTKLLAHVRQHSDGSYSRHAERCCFWSTAAINGGQGDRHR
jgi:hypothetical protein